MYTGRPRSSEQLCVRGLNGDIRDCCGAAVTGPPSDEERKPSCVAVVAIALHSRERIVTGMLDKQRRLQGIGPLIDRFGHMPHQVGGIPSWRRVDVLYQYAAVIIEQDSERLGLAFGYDLYRSFESCLEHGVELSVARVGQLAVRVRTRALG
jgi:hypothetical protein